MTPKFLFVCGDIHCPRGSIGLSPLFKVLKQIIPDKTDNDLELFKNQKSCRAYVRGQAYRSKCGIPAVSLTGHDQVFGTLVELNQSDLFWRLMDEFVGFNPMNLQISPFIRESTVVVTDVGESIEAWVYQINPLKLSSDFVAIEGGNWQQVVLENQLLTEKLTEKQKAYVRRLGMSTGREVIPIDLKLYRELMNLDLIVDKGRRLALSKLGQEVFKYID